MSRRGVKSFLDTNIFVYTFDIEAPSKRARAQSLVSEALEERRGIISYQVVQEFLSVATQKFAHPMSGTEAEAYLTKVLMPLCEVYPDRSLFLNALMISEETNIGFYDALIVSSATAAHCTVLLTEDLQHGRRIGELEIRNPFR